MPNSNGAQKQPCTDTRVPRQAVPTLCDFTPMVLAQLLLRPNKAIRRTVLEFEKEHHLSGGYIAVHLRQNVEYVRGWCMQGGHAHVEGQIIEPKGSQIMR